MVYMLTYLEDIAQRISDLLERHIISEAMISFPVTQPRRGDATVHFTEHGVLISMGDRFSSKLITTWKDVPVLYDILTDDVLGPLEFVETSNAYEFAKLHASLSIDTSSEEFGAILKTHYLEEFKSVDITWP